MTPSLTTGQGWAVIHKCIKETKKTGLTLGSWACHVQVGARDSHLLSCSLGSREGKSQADVQREAETRGGVKKVLATNPGSGPRSFLKPGYILTPGFLENPGVCRINSFFLPQLVKAGFCYLQLRFRKFNPHIENLILVFIFERDKLTLKGGSCTQRSTQTGMILAYSSIFMYFSGRCSYVC